MAYPFLPVNPCCTDVVLNTPCGCSSVMTTSGCNSNNPCSTHLTASSTIVYDSVALSCIVAEPCDTLNVILQKIDEIICNLQTQINYLTNQVTNITNQVININGDIINIYNTLDGCCSATTTSTSTTVRPCENFSLNNIGDFPVAIIVTDCTTQEQEAIVLMPGDTNICVITNSPLTVPGTVIVTPNGPCVPPTTTTTSSSTTSTTSTSSTTTTTTTAIPCECLTFSNTDSVSHSITYNDCVAGILVTGLIIDAYETIQVCGCCGLATSNLVTITVGANCIDGECPVPPTTTTTTTVPSCNCFDTEINVSSETLASTDNNEVTVLYNDCFGNPYINTYDSPNIYSLGCVDYSVGITVIGLIEDVEQILYLPIITGVPCCGVVPSTTTTTTTLPCTCVDIIISQTDLNDATGNTSSFFNGKVNLYPDKNLTCEDGDLEAYYSVAGTYTYCLKSSVIPTIELTYVKNNEIVTNVQSEIVNLQSACSVNGECNVTTTTTTTIPPTTTTTSSSSSTSTTTTSSSSSTTTSTTTVEIFPVEYCAWSSTDYQVPPISAYNVATNTLVPVPIDNNLTGFPNGTCTSSEKLWKHDPTTNTIREWFINSYPASLTFNRDITYQDEINFVTSAPIVAVDNNTILTTRCVTSQTYPSGILGEVYLLKYDISTNDAGVGTSLFKIRAAFYAISMMFTTDSKLIVSTFRRINNDDKYYLTQYSYPDGFVEADISLESISFNSSAQLKAFYVITYNSEIYLIRSYDSSLFKIDTTYPYAITEVTANLGFNQFRQFGSSTGECNNVSFTPSLTTTSTTTLFPPTTTTTTTLAPTGFNTIYTHFESL
jgi:hypothetical protein